MRPSLAFVAVAMMFWNILQAERWREIFSSTGKRDAYIMSAAADKRFRRATIVLTENVWGAANEREEGWNAEREWYYYRRPERLPNSW